MAKSTVLKKSTTAKTAADKAEVVTTAAAVATTEPTKKASAATKRKPAAPKTAVHLQFNGKDLLVSDILDQVIAAYKEKNSDTAVKKIDLYVVPDQNKAFYVINGEAVEGYEITL